MRSHFKAKKTTACEIARKCIHSQLLWKLLATSGIIQARNDGTD